ncbi:calcipressin-2-like [Mytilus galloprovincialis]
MPKALKESIEPERLDNRWDIMEIEDNISHAEDVGTGASMEREFMEDNTFTDLPNALIVTNVAECVFDDEDAKTKLEDVFRVFDEDASFQYLKCFRRVRVNYILPDAAVKARIHLHETQICGQVSKCFFVQPIHTSGGNSPHLKLPPLTKQFLISPPASPPLDWEPVHEAEPVINFDLLHAMANLAPGQSHELHPPSDKHPAIVVHICEDSSDPDMNQPPKIIQTRRPP